MDLFLSAEDSEGELLAELATAFPASTANLTAPLLVETEFPAPTSGVLPHLAFARQWLPNARPAHGESIRNWAAVIAEAVARILPDDQPWALHVEPHYGLRPAHHIGARAWHSATRLRKTGGQPPSSREQAAPAGPGAEAGRHRCRLIREATKELLQRKRRHLLRRLRPDAVSFTPEDSLVQVLLTAPNSGWVSIAPAPLPSAHAHLLSPYPRGELPVASDKAAPSRAFAKLVEAELRLGRQIEARDTCVDLGAAPGSWTYVAVHRGARVVAVDRSRLREDLMQSRQVQFESGDAFRYRPARRVDWLLCDVIAPPEVTTALLLEWLRQGWCRHFVVTLKLRDTSGAGALEPLKRELPALTEDFRLLRLCANKKEVSVFGTALAERAG